jgi:hypothetical protein
MNNKFKRLANIVYNFEVMIIKQFLIAEMQT